MVFGKHRTVGSFYIMEKEKSKARKGGSDRSKRIIFLIVVYAFIEKRLNSLQTKDDDH